MLTEPVFPVVMVVGKEMDSYYLPNHQDTAAMPPDPGVVVMELLLLSNIVPMFVTGVEPLATRVTAPPFLVLTELVVLNMMFAEERSILPP